MFNAEGLPWRTSRAVLPAWQERLARIGWRFGKFGVVGVVGVGVNLGVFWLLTALMHWHYLVAGAIAIETALCCCYVLNGTWTFADRRTRLLHLPQAIRYQAVSVGGMLINLGVLHLLVGHVSIRPVLANLTGIAFAAGWNFCMHLCWTWRR